MSNHALLTCSVLSGDQSDPADTPGDHEKSGAAAIGDFAGERVALAWHAAADCLPAPYRNATQAKNGEQFCQRHSKGSDSEHHTGLYVA
jgi:hypothetical protein